MNVYYGPNPLSKYPVVTTQMHISGGNIVNIEAIKAQLDQYFPGWLEDCPPLIGLESSHGLALMAAYWSKSLLNSIRGFIQDAGAIPSGSNGALLWVGHHIPQLTANAISLAIETIQEAIHNPKNLAAPFLISKINSLQMVCRSNHPDYIARILMTAAEADDIPVMNAPIGGRYWQYGWGCASRVFFEASPHSETMLGHTITRNKAITNQFLFRLGFPVSRHLAAQNLEEAQQHATTIGWPVVVKPIDRGGGRGVTVGVSSEAALKQAFNHARQFSQLPILIEQFVPGFDYRMLVIRGKLVAATRRDPPSVIGDGQNTVRQLIKQLNQKRAINPVLSRYLKQIQEEPIVIEYLKSQGFTPETVPAEGQLVTLRGNANVSTGGTPSDVISIVHADIRNMVESIAANIQLESLGVDYLTPDISRSWHQVSGCIIELNATPGLDLHVASGISETEMGQIVLGPDVSRIPVVVVVASIEDQRHLISALEKKQAILPQGTALVGPDFCQIGMLRLTLDGRRVHERFAQAIMNRQITSVIGSITPEEVLNQGFLIDRSNLTILRYDTKTIDPVKELANTVSDNLLDLRKQGIWASDKLLNLIVKTLREPLLKQNESTVLLRKPPKKVRQTNELDLTVLKPKTISNAPALFVIMRNEAYFCPFFFEHYRSLGIENFVVYDDHSTDGTLDYLNAQTDCQILTSGCRFNQRMPNGKPFHHNLKGLVPESLGKNRWVLIVDADEFLFLPNQFSDLAQFSNHLDKKNHTCVLASMVDFYPRYLKDRNHGLDISPFVASSYFDNDKSFKRPEKPGQRFVKLFGGIRPRLQNWLKNENPKLYNEIYQGNGYLMAALWKTPLLKTGTNTFLVNSHSANVIPPPEIDLALAHFKFHPGIDKTIAEALVLNNHYHGSIEYRFLKAAIDQFETRDLVFDGTRTYTGLQSLEESGFIRCEG